MTVLAYNLYRLLALELPPGYRHGTALTLFESLLETGADIQLDPDLCTVSLKKKRKRLGTDPSEPLPWLDAVKLPSTGPRAPDRPTGRRESHHGDEGRWQWVRRRFGRSAAQ